MSYSDFTVTAAWLAALALAWTAFSFAERRVAAKTIERPQPWPDVPEPKRQTSDLSEYQRHLARMEKYARNQNEILSVWLFVALGGLQGIVLIVLAVFFSWLSSPLLMTLVGGVVLFNIPILFGSSAPREQWAAKGVSVQISITVTLNDTTDPRIQGALLELMGIERWLPIPDSHRTKLQASVESETGAHYAL